MKQKRRDNVYSVPNILALYSMSTNEISIWHNNRCGKSREALKRLESKGLQYHTRHYMQELPDIAVLKAVLQKLGIPASEWVRRKEPVYRELFRDKNPSDDELLQAMTRHPQLIERPVIIKGNKAVIARPAERMDAIL